MVVIGAGLGGLCCAVELARQGFDVRVLEQHDKPGGYAHGFERKGFRFDASLHHLGGLDRGAMNRGLLASLGILDKLDTERRDHLARVEMPGLDMVLPNDLGALMHALGDRFPSQRAGLSELFVTLRQLKRHVTGPSVDPDFDVPPQDRLSTRWADRTIGDLVRRHIDDRQLQAVLTAPWPFLGLPPSKAAATWGACVFGSTWMEGAWRLRGGGAALSRALVARLEELGGACSTRSSVARILVDSGRVQGVETAGGGQILAPVAVSNANPWQTYGELLEPGAVPARFLALLRSMEPSHSFYALYLGLACAPSAVGIDQDEHFVLQQDDPDRSYAHMLAGEIEHSDWSIASFERADPDAAPPGRGVVTVMELTPCADWVDLDRDAYRARKRKVKERLLAKVTRRFPRLATQIVVAEMDTPRTMWRYTHNHRGAVYGLAQLPAQAGRKRLSNKAPLPGLFLTGAWTWAGGGYEGALMSGLQSADAVLSRHPAPAPIARGRLVARPEDLPPIPNLVDDATAFPHRVDVHAYREAVDDRGAVTPCSFLRFLDRGRVEACEASCDATAQDSWLQRFNVSVYRIDAAFPAVASQGAALEVRTGLRRVSSHRGVFDQRVVDSATKQTVVRAAVEVTFSDPEAGLMPVPQGFDDRAAPSDNLGPAMHPVPFSNLAHYPQEVPQRVYYEDTDAQGIVYHVTYLRWCEQVIEGLIGARGPRFRTVRLDIRYLEAARFADRLDIRIGARGIDADHIAVDLRMVRQGGGTVMADATLVLAFEDAQGSTAPVPPALQALVMDGA